MRIAKRWAIRHKSGNFLPQYSRDSTYGATWVVPAPAYKMRLFTTLRGARLALSKYLKGNMLQDWGEEGAYIRTNPVPTRRREDYEVVCIELHLQDPKASMRSSNDGPNPNT